ncbi:glutathione S-transferase family protein [Polycladidibacter stylochi]|uniref:glutathione S-transferase family protein n=1 Tax=Polycladidibacter stylochi TaxID=1807766 RepID=UPI000836F8A4|nr:glutathione S-transferase family protein [Pseudovibrio stylochi]
MLVLRSAPPSPFGRKVVIAAAVLGFKDKITVEQADYTSETDSLRQQNPLGKIPVLILEDATTLYDSRVITEYLDFLAGGEKLYPAGAARFEVLTKQALADGICDAAIQIVYEKRFHEEQKQNEELISYQKQKIIRALDAFSTNPLQKIKHSSPNGAQIALACALGYLDLRMEGFWRNDYPQLVEWLEDFAANIPEFNATKCV